MMPMAMAHRARASTDSSGGTKAVRTFRRARRRVEDRLLGRFGFKKGKKRDGSLEESPRNRECNNIMNFIFLLKKSFNNSYKNFQL